jgi:hypothetical protein
MPTAALYQTPTRALSKREQYEQIRSSLVSERQGSFDSHWRDLADFFFPRRTRFWTGDRNRGDKRSQHIIDSTGRFAARTLQSGMHAGLTSPARPWFKLGTPDPDLEEFGPVKEWLHVVESRMRTVFLRTNLYRALPTIYGDMGVFGTAACAILEDGRDLFRAYTFPLGSYALGVDNRGNATTFVREYQLTVRQLVTTFGGGDGRRMERPGQQADWSTISTQVKDAWDRGNYETGVDICWVVKPNDGADARRIESRFLPWSSCHYEKNAPEGVGGSNKFLRESGFQTFPILAPRWEVGSAEDAYGIDCPGMTALGDNKQLQLMQRRKGQGINKMVDPPLVGPAALRTQKVSLLPADLTYLDVREGQQGLKSIHDVNLRLDHLSLDMSQVQYRIQRAFFEDLFLMLASSDPARGAQPITAREVEERHEEKLLALGPVLESTNDELLDPLIDRVYAMMDSVGLLPDAPEELAGVDLKVEYISILAQAQKLVGVIGQDRFMQSVGATVQIFPQVRHKVDINRVVDNYGEMLGVDPRIIRSTEEAEQLTQQEAEAQQAIARAQQAKDLAGAVKSAAQAPMDQDSALTRLTRAVGGGG